MLAIVAVAVLAAGQSGATGATSAVTQTNVHFAWAHVLRVDPAYEMVPVPSMVCEPGVAVPVDPVSDGMKAADVEPAPPMAAVDTAAGDTAFSTAPPTGCTVPTETEMRRELAGYDVEYRFRGEVYFARLPYDPGGRLRVRVTVSPAE